MMRRGLVAEDVFGVGVASKRVRMEYLNLTDHVADEFSLLLETPIEAIAEAASDPRLSEAIRRMREGRVTIKPGYDGIFGTVKLLGERQGKPKQKNLL